MHIAGYKKKQKQRHQLHPHKNGTQPKKHPLMPFENNGTLQKWHMTNTPPKVNKYYTQNNGAFKNGMRCEKIPKGYLPSKGRTEWFLKENS